MSVFDNQILLGTIMVLLSVLFHVAGLVFLATMLKRISSWTARLPSMLQSMTLLVVGLLTIIALHLVEALGWAVLYVQLNEFEELEKALYFSVTTATTLGYGDITLSPRWQLMSTLEAIAGLLLFGASTAFLLGLVKRLFEDFDGAGK
ncbi:MAG: potassium channel family protein [Acidobacteriota bacterium]|nr:potassium channel family protein [Acidobacteriota bacterium]